MKKKIIIRLIKNFSVLAYLLIIVLFGLVFGFKITIIPTLSLCLLLVHIISMYYLTEV